MVKIGRRMDSSFTIVETGYEWEERAIRCYDRTNESNAHV